MTEILNHLDRVSIFDHSAIAFFLILAFNWAFTAIHIYEEWRGTDAPLWRVFGAVVGLWLPNWLGFLLFTVALTLVQWAAGLAGIGGWFFGQASLQFAVGALGFIVGARISDTVISHWSLYALGYRPNPGLRSTPLYVLEAIFLVLTFWRGLASSPDAAWKGFALGILFFLAVLPLMRLVRAIAPPWRHEPWKRWQPLPAWAKD
jgi:hypothetical protein